MQPNLLPEEITMSEVTDPDELVKARAQDARFARNSAWLQMHATEIYTQYRGKCICIAGEELFIADTPERLLGRPEQPILKRMAAS